MQEKKTPIGRLMQPVYRFIQLEKSGGVVLGISVIVAILLANSAWADSYHHFLQYRLGLHWNGITYFEYTLHHWINDGLMAIFFFVVGLELKREIIAGQLSDLRSALLPIGAALGGMVVPAAIYLVFNQSTETSRGWGIPMATDIAFALGVLYLLGSRIPMSLKVFLTALAIVDDLGAVLVIAFFYTSDISLLHLSIGGAVLVTMYAGNRLGVRNILFYAVLGIGGAWTGFLLSGVHATIAAVLAAFTIPADVKIKEQVFIGKLQDYLRQFKTIDINDRIPTLTNEQLHVLEQIQKSTIAAIPPLQRLEQTLHPVATFIVLPIFALANAGVSLNIDPADLFSTPIALGVFLGLLVGKLVGVVGFTLLMIRSRLSKFPAGMNYRNLIGLGLLASIGFTMSLFVASLAFTNDAYIAQAKIGIFAASIVGGMAGYIVLNRRKN